MKTETITLKGNPVTERCINNAEKILAKINSGEHSRRLIVSDYRDQKIIEEISKNKTDDRYSRWHYHPGSRNNAVKQNDYLTEDEVRRHLTHSLANHYALKN